MAPLSAIGQEFGELFIGQRKAYASKNARRLVSSTIFSWRSYFLLIYVQKVVRILQFTIIIRKLRSLRSFYLKNFIVSVFHNLERGGYHSIYLSRAKLQLSWALKSLLAFILLSATGFFHLSLSTLSSLHKSAQWF